MMLVKVQCGCGQKYSFDVEPVNGSMPWAVACPVCGTDGTAAANIIIARNLGPSAAAAPAPIRTTVAAPVAAHAPAPMAAPAPLAAPAPAPARTPAPAPISLLKQAVSKETDTEEDKWKWWYYVLGGIFIGAYSIWQSYTQHQIKPLGELIPAVGCILVGLWVFQSKRRKKQASRQQHQS